MSSVVAEKGRKSLKRIEYRTDLDFATFLEVRAASRHVSLTSMIEGILRKEFPADEVERTLRAIGT